MSGRDDRKGLGEEGFPVKADGALIAMTVRDCWFKDGRHPKVSGY